VNERPGLRIVNTHNITKELNGTNVSFALFLIHDVSPSYEMRNFGTSSRHVNQKMHDLGMTVQEQTTALNGSIYTTHNIQETKDVLNGFGLMEEFYIRHNFSNIAHMFQVLNDASNLQYVVPRDYYASLSLAGTDIDLIVSDFFIAKSALDAESIADPGARFEDVGDHGSIKNRVTVNGQHVEVDIRFLGDQYYDCRWQQYMLQTRVLLQNTVYVPKEEDHVFGLLYHGLAHNKPEAALAYHARKLRQKFLRHNIPVTEAGPLDIHAMRHALNTFLWRRNYTYTCSLDSTVGCNFCNGTELKEGFVGFGYSKSICLSTRLGWRCEKDHEIEKAVSIATDMGSLHPAFTVDKVAKARQLLYTLLAL